MLNYHTFNFEFYSSTCYTEGMFQRKIPFKDNKVVSYLKLILF